MASRVKSFHYIAGNADPVSWESNTPTPQSQTLPHLSHHAWTSPLMHPRHVTLTACQLLALTLAEGVLRAPVDHHGISPHLLFPPTSTHFPALTL